VPPENSGNDRHVPLTHTFDLIQQVFNEPDPNITEELQQLKAFLERGWDSAIADVDPGEVETT
jgi:hypothetical protein